jgi:hypothetical protein
MGSVPGSLVAAAALLAAQPLAPAQATAGRLPPLGAAEYSRTTTASSTLPLRSAAAAKAALADQRVPDRYLPRLVPAPWVCQGELRADQRALAAPVRDLRDLLRALACDLASQGALRARFPRLLPFGDVVVSGGWSALAGDGTQALRATVAVAPVSAEPGEGRDAVARLRAFCVPGVVGTVTLQRTIDAARGLVVSFDGALDFVVDEGERSCRRLVVADQWRLIAVRDNQDADFRRRVAAAIRDGVRWVRDCVDGQKSFLVDKGGDERNYGSGRLALALLTLRHGHVDAADPVLQRGFAELRRRRLEDSYSLATALMALAALHTPPGAVERLREGGLAAQATLSLPDRDRELAAKWLRQLLANVDPRAPADELRFNYTAGPRFDTSLQQYGLLGMWAALTMGVEPPAGAFAGSARQLLAVQCPAAGTMTLRLTSHAQVRAAAGTGIEPAVSEQRAAVRGHAYQDANEAPYGSMTAAGLSGLLLARAGMAAGAARDRALEGRIDAAIRDGYAWLAATFSVRCNPGAAPRADRHWYYWLYCLERACELAGIAHLHGRDWYYEGALQLLSQQQANGSFRAEHDATLLLDSTCLAVLFLAKATAPVPVTGR